MLLQATNVVWPETIPQKVAFALFAFFILSVPFHGDFLRLQPIGAFGAFYCGARVVRAGGNPYLTEPLRSCERSLPSYHYGIEGAVEPVPLPGYAIASFILLSPLPFKAAFLVFSLLSILATIAALVALTRITGLGAITVGTALLLSDLFHNLAFGELPPLIIGALALAALFLTQRRTGAATAALGVSLIEPHVTLPAVVAVAIGMPTMRRPLFAMATLLLLISLAATGPREILAYFTSVLPAQAAAELPASDQLSLSWLLNFLGFDDRTALVVGSTSYVLCASFGVMLGVKLARRLHNEASLILIPPAIAMIGGPFVHDIQLPIALPGALLLVACSPVGRGWSRMALITLAMPWTAYSRLIAFAGPAIAAILVASLDRIGSPFRRIAAVVGTVAAVSFVFLALQGLDARQFNPVEHLPQTMAQSADARENASALWSKYVRISGYGESSPRSVGEKVPLVVALLVLAGTATASSVSSSSPLRGTRVPP